MGYVEDLKGSKHGRGRNRWRARWRDPSGRQRTKSFARKVDADGSYSGWRTPSSEAHMWTRPPAR
jgi:predicted phage gp36 major capsid-like protein